MAEKQTQDHRDSEQTARELVALLAALSRELHPQRGSGSIGLDSRLDQDLGFDSLARAEVLLRLERRFGVTLPESLLMSAETVAELLREVLKADRESDLPPQLLSSRLQPTESVPEQARTLQQVLEWHVAAHGDRPHLYLYSDARHFETISYATLQREALQVATLLLARGLEPGQGVAIMLPTCRQYFASFFGTLLAGAVPVPIYPPSRPSQLEEHMRRHVGILNNAEVRLMITVAEAMTVSRLLKSQVKSLTQLIAVTEFEAIEPVHLKTAARGGDLALLQYTSGSTGNPKGVMLTHDNLLANIRAIGRALAVDSTDVCVSWLPLYHDMGLIGSWLSCVYFATPLVSFSPLLFLTRPQLWLQLIHRHRGTISAAPNFAYDLCLRKLQPEDLQRLELSCWRAALNGAEAVSPKTLRDFSQRLRPAGLRADVLMPVYGLAEASVALAFPPIARGPLIDRVRRQTLMAGGRAEPTGAEDDNALEFPSVGRPLAGHQIRIVDAGGHELPERLEGRLEFRGPSVTQGYYRNPQQTRQLRHGDWYDSGDRGYMAAGEVFITGRSKDIIIRAGRNLYPHELEEAVSAVAGVHKGGVAVFACAEPGQSAERLVVVAETRLTEAEQQQRMRQQIHQHCLNLLGTVADDIVLAPPRSVPKTSSGKVRRAACSELYRRGALGKEGTALWWQLSRLALAALVPQLRRSGRTLSAWLYGGYLWALLLVLGPGVWLLLMVLPRRRWRHQLARGGARLLAWMSGTAINVEGAERLPASTCVLVANHCSYLDGLLLTAALPPEYSFVAKVELRRNPLLRLLLSRLDTEFVERFDLQRGLADARRLAADTRGGQSLIFFPEGTFDRIPGLRTFHMGAFTAAAEAAVPLVPVSIRGSRSKLREGSWLPRRGAIELWLGTPLLASGRDWDAALDLRARARAEILAHCGEPDREAD